MDLIHPVDAAEVAEALGAGRTTLVVGGRRHISRRGPVDADAELWTSALDRIVAYDPAEMIAVVQAGVRLGDLRSALAEGGQEWPSDEPDEATVGGVIAAGVDPVRRMRVGLLRDSVVEMEAVLGDGRTVTSGARVVKNVSGFDVHRLLTGSLGTLGVITQVALKVRPLPAARRTLVTREGGLDLGARVLDALWRPAAVLVEPDRIVVHLEGWPAEVAEQEASVRALIACETSEAGVTPGVDTFPDSPHVVELGVVPSRLRAALDGLDAYRALAGVGVAWVPCGSDEEVPEVLGRGDGAVLCRSTPPLTTARRRTELEERVRATLDPAGVFAVSR